jgi:hypothetical protein
MITSAWITVLPPRMMLVVPIIWERRETLLPVSWGTGGVSLLEKERVDGRHLGRKRGRKREGAYGLNVFAFHRLPRHGCYMVR